MQTDNKIGSYGKMVWVTYSTVSEDWLTDCLTRWLGGLAVLAGADLLHQVAVVVAVEGHGPVHQRVEQDPHGPAVHLGPLVGTPVHDLRRGVQRAPAERLQELVAVVEIRQAEISNLE